MPSSSSPCPPLPTILVDLILAIALSVIDLNALTSSTSKLDPLLVNLIQVLPHRTIPSAFKSILLYTNTDYDKTDFSTGSAFDLDGFLSQMVGQHTGDLPGSPLAWYLNQLVALAGLYRTEFPCKFVWAVLQLGHWTVLEWLLAQPSARSLFVEDHVGTVLAGASYHGSVHVLQHWKDQGLPIEYSNTVAQQVGQGGSTDTLLWWDSLRRQPDLGLIPFQQPASWDELELADSTWQGALGMGHVAVLQRIYAQYKEAMRDDANALLFWSPVSDWVLASQSGFIHILEWANNTKLPFPDWDDSDMEDLPMDIASHLGLLDVLEWWNTAVTDKPLPYSHRALEQATAAGRIDVLDWWLNSGLDLAFTPHIVQLALDHGHAKAVQWWHACGVYKQVASGGVGDPSKESLIPRHPITLASFGQVEWLKLYWTSPHKTPNFVLRAVCNVVAEFGEVEVLKT